MISNDSGGNANKLWSLDDGISDGGNQPTDLFAQDAIGAVQYSASGAKISIKKDGQVSYTMTTASMANFQSLGADKIGTDTFTYAIELGNGTISWATATVEIKGNNHAAVLSSAVVVLAETNAALSTSGTLTISDVDNPATFVAQSATVGTFSINTAGAWTFTANSAFNNLNVGTSVSNTFSVAAADGTTTLVKITINGTNDAAILSSAVVVLAETNAALTTGGKIGLATGPNRIACGTGRGRKNSLRKRDCCSRLRVLSKSRRDWRFDHKCPVSITQ